MEKRRDPLWMENDDVVMLDQRRLPHTESFVRCPTYRETIRAIVDMTVRGAGSIGIAGAYAVAQALHEFVSINDDFLSACREIRMSRPTAVNLTAGVTYVTSRLIAESDKNRAVEPIYARRLAVEFAESEKLATEQIGLAGARLLDDKNLSIMTHCNAGWLAYPGYGTALAPIYYRLKNKYGRCNVFATETRPRSQGAKLTVWELQQAGVPVTLIADTAAGYMMSKDRVDAVIVGADRITVNGDTINKIGTYALAVLAQDNGIPFYVAAPTTTFDGLTRTGDEVEIEERSPSEVSTVTDGVLGFCIAPLGTKIENPAFDVTRESLVTAFITERGVFAPGQLPKLYEQMRRVC